MSKHPTTNFAYSIQKETKKSFVDIEMKRKKFVPDAKYKYDMDQFSKLSHGTNIPHYKRGR